MHSPGGQRARNHRRRGRAPGAAVDAALREAARICCDERNNILSVGFYCSDVNEYSLPSHRAARPRVGGARSTILRTPQQTSHLLRQRAPPARAWPEDRLTITAGSGVRGCAGGASREDAPRRPLPPRAMPTS
jgi:hypothetical protein